MCVTPHHRHTPFTHAVGTPPSMHTTLQAEQLLGSFAKFTQVDPPQFLVPAGHWQLPPSQNPPIPGHAVPHALQLLGSV